MNYVKTKDHEFSCESYEFSNYGGNCLWPIIIDLALPMSGFIIAVHNSCVHSHPQHVG